MKETFTVILKLIGETISAINSPFYIYIFFYKITERGLPEKTNYCKC